jgi:two-component system, LytTR family, sensor kinase
MQTIFILPKSRFLRHLLFWVWVYLVDVFVFGVGYENIPLFLKLALLEMPGQLFFAYLIMYWVVPRYIRDKQIIKWSFVTVLAFLACGIIGHALFIGFKAYTTDPGLWDIPKIFLRGFYSVLKACLAVLVKLGVMWYENEKKVAALEKAKLEGELKMLKEQVNPHFMFNTLNNLYGLIARNPEQAQESVIRLSGILQFMLHESNHMTIPIQRELQCVRDYVDLEKIRYSERLSVSIQASEEVSALSIAPLLLFPLVENSFKHGVADNLDEAWINLHCSIDRQTFVFTLENSKAPARESNISGGIGLTNVRRRLELMYPDAHSFQTMDSDDSFMVVLKIQKSKMNGQSVELYEAEMSYR